MTEKKSRALGDLIWTIVGLVGVACIAIALYLLIFDTGGGGDSGSVELARELHESGREKLEAGEYEDALRALAKAESIAVKHAEEFESSWREELKSDILKAVSAHADELWKSGVAKLSAGDAAGAAEDLRRAVDRTHRRHPLYLNHYGEALAVLGEADRAQQAWRNAAILNPFFPKPYYNLAKSVEKAGNLPRALSLSRAALALFSEAGVPEGLAEKVSKLTTDLAPTFEKETNGFRANYRANPADWEAFNYLLFRQLHATRVAEDASPVEGLRDAILEAGRGIGDLTALRKRQESAVADRADSVIDRGGLGTIFLFQGEFDRARTVFKEALALSDSDPLSLLGEVLAGLLSGENDEALNQKVAERFNGNQIAWVAFGAGLIADSKTELAVKALHSALLRDAGMPEVYRLLGLAYTGEAHEKNREAVLRAYRRIP